MVEGETAETAYNLLEDLPLPRPDLLPHQHASNELDRYFPMMPRPGERVDSLPDLGSPESDPLVQCGEGIARAIIREAELYGRRRKPAGTAAPYDGGTC